MDSCTLYSHFFRQQQIYDLLRQRYGSEAISLEGTPEAWEKLTITGGRSVFFRKSLIEITARTRPQLKLGLSEGNDPLTQSLRGMYSYFAAVEAEKPELQQQLLTMISSFNLELGVVGRPWFSKRGDHWEMLLELTQALEGLLFIGSHKLLGYTGNGNALLNGAGKLVFDEKGKSQVEQLEVKVNASLMGAKDHSSPEAAARRQGSLSRLKEKEVPFFEGLPLLPDAADLKPRGLEAVAERALCLALVALKGEGLEQAKVQEVMQQYELEPLLSPVERSFVATEQIEAEDRARFTWRYEGYWTLLWALGWVEKLDFPVRICDPGKAIEVMVAAKSQEGFKQQSRLRPLAELLDETDVTYCLHWAVVDARLRGEEPPAELEPGVVYERHYALNWLIDLAGEAWDEVSVHT
jgi:hypothetical protein